MKELVEIQNRLKAPKGQWNSFGKYKYRSCEDILEALKPLLYEQKCQLTISDDVIQVGDRIYVKATVRLRNESGEEIATSGFAREEDSKKGMDGSQVTGASSSYARKYALNGMFCIDDTKDSDTTNTGDSGVRKSGEDAEYLAMAIQEVERSTAVGYLTEIWNRYAFLQKERAFVDALKKRKGELNGTSGK